MVNANFKDILDFFRYFIKDKSSESLVMFFIIIFIYNFMLKLYATFLSKCPKSQFDKLTFIIQTSSHFALKKNDKKRESLKGSVFLPFVIFKRFKHLIRSSAN